MKRKFSSIFLHLFVLTACSTAFGQMRDQLSPGFGNLTLEISTNKNAFLPLEPIAITFKVTNTTTQQILAHDNFSFANSWVKLSLRSGESTFQEIASLSPFVAHTYITPAYLQPGQHWQVTNLLNYELSNSFGEPGTYDMFATFRVHKGSEVIISSPITIEVTQPTGENLEAYRFLKTNTAGKDFFTGLKDFSALEQFVAEHKESDYGDFAVYFLGVFYYVRHDYEKAQASFEYVSGRKDFPLTKEVKDSLNESKNRLKMKENP